MAKKKLTVACSPLTSTIFAGTTSREGVWSSDKQDVTEEAVNAVAQYFVQKKCRLEFTALGKRYVLKVEEIDLSIEEGK